MRRLVIFTILALVAPFTPVARALPLADLVTIYRDDYGVPHVVGETREAMSYGAGYALATDRLFEMDVIRRLGQGRLAEILGAGSDRDGDGVGDQLQADMIMRREFHDAADIRRQTDALPAEIRSMLQAFADGVNAAAAAQLVNPAEAPVLFGALGYVPEPWTPADSTTVLLLFTMVSFAGEGEGGELDNAKLLADLVAQHGTAQGTRIWQDLLLSVDPEAEAVIDHGEGPAPSELAADEPSTGQLDLAVGVPSIAEAASVDRREFEVVRDVLAHLPKPKIGSYMVAANGDRSASGDAIMLGAPQAGFLAPSVFYEMGLHGPGVDCTGFTVPGLGPLIGIGWCNDHAWSLVAGNAGDQVDVFIETLHPDDPHRYLFDGQWRDMEVRTETYVAKSTVSGEAPTVVTQDILSTVHGPVFHLDPDGGVAYTHKRSQAGHFAQTFEGTYALTSGDGLDEVLAGAERITATYNLVYADRDGNISYRFTGWQPVRAEGADLRLPMPGTGTHEWRARALDFDAMPNVVNPARGVLNVNQGVDSKPISWWPRSSSIFIGRFGHTASDKALFDGVTDLDIPTLENLNRRLISDEDLLTQQLHDVIEEGLQDAPAGSDLTQARSLYEDWRAQGYPRVDADGDGLLDHAAVTLFSADRLNFRPSRVWGRWIDAVWTPHTGHRLPGPYIGRFGMTLAAIDSPELFSLPYGDGAVAKFPGALAEEIDALRAEFGDAPMTDWRIPAPRTSFDAVGLLSPPAMDVVDHGTYSQIVDLGRDTGVNVLPPGNGRADSALDVARYEATGEFPPHFVDQIELYETFRHKPMLMRPAGFTDDPESVEVLVYP